MNSLIGARKLEKYSRRKKREEREIVEMINTEIGTDCISKRNRDNDINMRENDMLNKSKQR